MCALRLLKDPLRAPDTKAQREMRAVVDAGGAVPNEVYVAIFDERSLAREWLKIKHRGRQGGVGTLSWTPTSSERFDQQEGGNPTANAQALALLDYAVHEGLLTTEERESGVPKDSVLKASWDSLQPAIEAMVARH